jgi:glycolate oxidase FAD binding subunit
MYSVTPRSAEDLAAALQEAADKRRTVTVIGSNSKKQMAGPILPSDVLVSTVGLKKIVEYEPNDLTISVEAGHNFSELQHVLASRGQMIALDPPFSSKATIGGVVASNSNGPMRRAYGTARDLVIGMKFAMLNGKIVRVGGMVVKNVSGLDIGKLMIGSFGTLAVMTTINLRLHPLPEETQTYLYSFADLDEALQKRDEVLRSPLRPMAIDLISPAAAARLGADGYVLAIRAGGTRVVLRRYERELSYAEKLAGSDEALWWSHVREFPAEFLKRQPNGVVLRIGTTITDLALLLKTVSGAFVARAGSGVSYLFLSSWQAVSPFWEAAHKSGWSAAAEYSAEEARQSREMWLLRSAGKSDSSFVMMEKIKQMFDPNNLLNRSRLYGRL